MPIKPKALLLTCLIGLAVPMVGLAQPTITTQPQSQANALGSTMTLSVEAAGVLPLVYQWRKTGVPVAGATNAALIFTNIQSPQAGNYTVAITNVEGAVTSVVATLTVLLPPSIVPSTSLQNKAAYVETLASFTVTATGTAPLGIQWRLDGRELPGQTNRILTFNAVQPADEGDYTVMVTNVAGATARNEIDPWAVAFDHQPDPGDHLHDERDEPQSRRVRRGTWSSRNASYVGEPG